MFISHHKGEKKEKKHKMSATDERKTTLSSGCDSQGPAYNHHAHSHTVGVLSNGYFDSSETVQSYVGNYVRFVNQTSCNNRSFSLLVS